MFEYDETKRRAIDREQGLVVEHSPRFHDDGVPNFFFADEKHGSRFEFFVRISVVTREMIGLHGQKMVGPVTTGAVITGGFDPYQSKYRYSEYMQARGVSEAQLSEEIREGLACLLTFGGEQLINAPEFSVKFADEVPHLH